MVGVGEHSGGGRSGREGWRGFNFVSQCLNGPHLLEACAFYPFTDEETALSRAGTRTSPQQAVPPSRLQALRKVVQRCSPPPPPSVRLNLPTGPEGECLLGAKT